jgi:hypothetical protein
VGATVSYSLGSNSTCLSASADLGEVNCWSDSSPANKKFYLPAAAAVRGT